jgi:hypothetical protein
LPARAALSWKKMRGVEREEAAVLARGRLALKEVARAPLRRHLPG